MIAKKLLSIILICLFSGTFVFGQKGKGQDNKKENTKQQTEQKPSQSNRQGDKNDQETTRDDNQQKQDQTQTRENEGKREQKGDQHQAREQKKEGEQRGQGHAYGRDKGDMSGREFGMIRSEESRNKMKGKFDEAEAELDRQENVVSGMFENIENARVRNEEKFQKGAINKAQYEANKTKIQEAEEIASKSQTRVKEEKRKVTNARKEMGE